MYKKRNRLICFSLAFVMIFALSSCKKENNSNKDVGFETEIKVDFTQQTFKTSSPNPLEINQSNVVASCESNDAFSHSVGELMSTYDFTIPNDQNISFKSYHDQYYKSMPIEKGVLLLPVTRYADEKEPKILSVTRHKDKITVEIEKSNESLKSDKKAQWFILVEIPRETLTTASNFNCVFK